MEWQGQPTPVETILYDIRCNLVHEATMHQYVLYDPRQDRSQLVIKINPDEKFVFQDSLLECLFKCIHNVKENAGELKPIPFAKTAAGKLKTANREFRIITKCLRIPLP